ncbi:redoxin domain-containing protein [bacterium]|nr:redoxin domain-containing protein [candidate division CSSED10-310 bacterium]
MKNRRITFGIAALCAMLALTAPALAVYEVGDFVTDFTLNDAYGNPVSLYDYTGMVIVLAFWTPT